MPKKSPKKGSVDRRSSADNGASRQHCPTVAELLAVIAEYNKAQELDLAILNSGAERIGENEFLKNLYLAAEGAARALRPIMQVHLGVVPSSKIQNPSSKFQVLKTPRIIPQVLGSDSGIAGTADNGADLLVRTTEENK